jgi:hypothetical protein
LILPCAVLPFQRTSWSLWEWTLHGFPDLSNVLQEDCNINWVVKQADLSLFFTTCQLDWEMFGSLNIFHGTSLSFQCLSPFLHCYMGVSTVNTKQM